MTDKASTETVRKIAEQANKRPALGMIANSADLPREALQILDDFARLKIPDTVSLGVVRPRGSALVIHKLLAANGYAFSMAFWIEG